MGVLALCLPESLYNLVMQPPPALSPIPDSLQPYFQEYNLAQLDMARDANLIILRTLEFGTWDEIRWLFATYGAQRIRRFLRQYGQRWLKPVTFHYWRKLMRIRRWRQPPFASLAGEIWER